MRRATLRGYVSGSTVPRLEVSPCDNGSVLQGYVRLTEDDALSSEEINYLGAFSVPKLLRLADTIRRHHAKWLDKKPSKAARQRQRRQR